MSPDWTAVSGGSDALVRAVLAVAALLLAGPAVRAVLGQGLAALSVVPGRTGRLAAAAGKAVRPGIVRRLVAVVVGLGLPAASVVVSAPAAQARSVDLAGPIPARAPSHTAASGTADPAPRQAGTAARPAGAGFETAEASVVVVRGDTLWDIARRHLPVGASATEVARDWPRWYAANRAAIGPDPSLLRPGTRLRRPDLRSAGTPSGIHDRPATTPGSSVADRVLAQSLDPDRR